MTNEPFGPLVVFVYLAAVVLSLPASAAVLLFARRVGVERGAGLVGVVGLALVASVSVGVGVVVGADAGLAIAGYGIVAVVVLWTLPALVGRWLVQRVTDLAPDLALGYAVAGVPVALAASAIWFVAPGGPTRYNLTFLTGPTLWAATAVLLAIVVLGPGVVGVALIRLVGRRRG